MLKISRLKGLKLKQSYEFELRRFVNINPVCIYMTLSKLSTKGTQYYYQYKLQGLENYYTYAEIIT